ncbi:L-serine dehydratase [Clostridium acetobutylicum]|uniref:L-serine dehydratase n=1 Tax=Clostridium acetobutylicum (strain ATCC 824 / DSM 792 / JCM 1419 / IAM 19013 / LMG 5710 / NBRC 13948 / NRRL B-527 / VKM B-1787 / 2291 / W) TaxID=272562 RepID=Q97L88_CLOAB|nr:MULTISPECIES: L-serine ammonia-lyase, iron-sulfur-dependent, subunit alpha [Clostridium]AAK78651.1 L-serine dehydratase, alpha chain [Clostridium acetobutylicum ATCC 824]ADZ19725.1 L-serine dehydratase, alpha chain [Clostridium acetobutylicum EA 2018]AEI31374.1 L-serine dehydratase, alpha chain [Clostridium acetobutylicum DSM 1731]AWV80372.1 L-serine ammonia-lyase, iron-sulfur-dependent, subunit alpha [Clostridium acetobutylicum]MBC2392560.1 L-serine ammonia-lyase, iron-sulfur-dependent, su
MFVDSGEKLIEECTKRKISIADYTIEEEISKSQTNYEYVFSRMKKNLEVMKSAAEYGTENKVKSMSGLIGGDGFKLNNYSKKEDTITGSIMVKAMARAIACSEVNASMGKIVAAPTAGSCGILPAVILTVGEKFSKSDDELTKALFTASGIGMLIAKNATLSGAEGGCQAECGSAAAMGAGAVVEMLGGTPEMALDAASIVIKNVLGLVCDPVAGLVEVPCSKRNVSGAVNAITTADMVMAGVGSIIPFDDSVSAMYRVGKQLPCELRETALGGLAVTKKGQELKNKIMK